MFNLIGARDDLEGASVLDLFAGSGALGCEALSRGARRCVFVDSSPSAVAAVKDNLRRISAGNQEVLRADGLAALANRRDHEFDLVFLDPPYAGAELQPALDRLAECPSPLALAGLVVIEHPSELVLPRGLKQLTTRKYGDTRVTLARREPAEPASSQREED
jgi:16S rRNA (guanine966-N2)-methyltransferase